MRRLQSSHLVNCRHSGGQCDIRRREAHYDSPHLAARSAPGVPRTIRRLASCRAPRYFHSSGCRKVRGPLAEIARRNNRRAE